MKRSRAAQKQIVRTSLELPEELWRRGKQRALDERTDFRALVIEGLELRLARKPKKNAARK